MAETRFEAKRITRTYRQTIHARKEVVFPLLCPRKEADWLPGWRYEMLFSISGAAEPGAVFTTPLEGEPDTVWVISRHEPTAGHIDFVRVTPGIKTCLLKIAVTSRDESSSHVDISYTYTALSESGNRFIERFSNETFQEAMAFWETSMNDYLA